jgi:hypothetical protein
MSVAAAHTTSIGFSFKRCHRASFAEVAAASPLLSLVCAALEYASAHDNNEIASKSTLAYMMQPLAPDGLPQHVLQQILK